jgi:hypothetical protein
MNHTFGFPEAADSPSEPELQERTPAGAFREFLPELPRLITIAHHAAHNARTPDAAHCWVKTHQRLLTLQAEIHDALRVEQLDDARTAHEENP